MNHEEDGDEVGDDLYYEVGDDHYFEVGDDHYYEVGNDGDDESEPEVIPSMRRFQSLLFRPKVRASI